MLMKLAPFAAIAVAAGIAGTLQGAANAGLYHRIGLSPAVLVNCILVFVAALIFWLAAGAKATFTAPGIPWTFYLGGILGFFIVGSMAYVFPRLGSAMAIACFVFGNALAALLVDHFGVMGVSRSPITLPRVVGILFVAGGVIVMRWEDLRS